MKIFKLNGRVKFKELPMQRYDYFNYLNSMDAVKLGGGELVWYFQIEGFLNKMIISLLNTKKNEQTPPPPLIMHRIPKLRVLRIMYHPPPLIKDIFSMCHI